MWAWAFLTRQVQHWQMHDSWQKHDDVCPYWMGHIKRKRALSCVGEYHFKKYCKAPAKLRKLYWHLHPTEAMMYQANKMSRPAESGDDVPTVV